jgi:hypothetical protein
MTGILNGRVAFDEGSSEMEMDHVLRINPLQAIL